MNEKEDKIGKLLNLPPLALEEKKENPLVEMSPPETQWEQAESDFDAARDAILNALETSEKALEKLAQIAVGSQHPRSFEVLAKLVDTIRDTGKDLINIHQQKKDLIKAPEQKNTINNNLVISTNDLLKMIKNQNEDDR
jgi:hypothetical protein